ncbi:glutathione S-transferase domain-containing protein [Alcanivorax hongdengensis A-11-3]|uniref:Glutathione S-transferase domain-containing protein n=1 Tax=Alcanivorax hongdengensis A-11-3 TaxID=1177179 RepID=L0W9S8_9GAMM|nr:glutathione S-transferase family protein [Alcanivorax hongdengensis]EKF73754.1 glutathione S-transferase domain-containing protein [Alcanivorax hongdengensis A-11-3]
MNQPELWQMHFSMYQEKVRWALDYKRVPHIRHSLLPGPHAAQLMPRFGQKAMPILRHDGKVLKNSAAILSYIEQTWPDPPLYPQDPALREQALKTQKWFDEKIGPAVRCATFYEILPDTEYSARRIASGLSGLKQKLYVGAFPAVRAVMMLDMKITPDSAEAGRILTQEALDFVAENAEQTGYLVGGQFSVADLTAATVLFPTCFPPEFPVDIPKPLPPGWEAWLKRWQAHKGCEYVRRIYREYRGQSAAIDG